MNFIQISVEDTTHFTSAYQRNQLFLDYCNKTLNFWEAFYRREHPHFFKYVPYNILSAIYIEWINKCYLFIWSFMDVFIIVVSIGLGQRFEQIGRRMQKVKGQQVRDSFWAELRYDYVQLSDFLLFVDDFLAYTVLISCFSNIYFITVQLFNSFSPKYLLETRIYFWWSLIYLISRTITMIYHSSCVNISSKKPLKVLRATPTTSYTLNVQRFIEQIVNDESSLSGKNFFFLKRKLMLAVKLFGQ